jgi:hypothetical protein
VKVPKQRPDINNLNMSDSYIGKSLAEDEPDLEVKEDGHLKERQI